MRLSASCCTAIILSLVTTVLPAAAGDPPATRFTGTAVVDGPQGTRRMPVTVVVTRYTSHDEAQALRATLEQGGQRALQASLRGRQDGVLELGALRSPIALAVAAEGPGGWEYLFLTPRRLSISERDLGAESLDYPFGMALVRIGAHGRGEGDLHVAAALEIAPDGWVEVADLDGAEGRFEEVRAGR